jgi:hypothetical protein
MTQIEVIEKNGRAAEREGFCGCGCGCGMGTKPEPREEARPNALQRKRSSGNDDARKSRPELRFGGYVTPV